MIIFGALGAWVSVCILALGWSDFQRLGKTISIILLAVFMGMMVYDLASPITVEEKAVITNDYERYGLSIESDKMGEVRVSKHIPDFWGAVSRSKTVYSFIGFLE